MVLLRSITNAASRGTRSLHPPVGLFFVGVAGIVTDAVKVGAEV